MCIDLQSFNYKIVDGKMKIDFKSNGVIKTHLDKVIQLPCGKCLECQRARSSEWATRCVLESFEHEQNCILTLTYCEEKVPFELSKRDYQLFLKRLRKYIYPVKIKYFLSGEYGSKFGRPHFHVIIFGWCPSDVDFAFSDKNGTRLGSSSIVESLWGNGFVSVGVVDYKSCLYSAKYLQKSVECIQSKYGLTVEKPFIRCSKGIGRAFAERLGETDSIYINGKKYHVPRYFDKVREQIGVNMTAVKSRRFASLSRRFIPSPFYKGHPFGYSERFIALSNEHEQQIRLKRKKEEEFLKNS